MNCKYCQEKLYEICKTNITASSCTINSLCETCHVDYEFVQYPNEEMVLREETIFSIKIRDKEFVMTFHYGSRQTTIYYSSWVQVKVGGDAFPTRMKHTLHIFPYLLDWTPFNAKDKLTLLLPFF